MPSPAGYPESSIALEASHVFRTKACAVKALLITNTGAAQFVQVHDATSVPADSAVPLLSFYVAEDTTLVIPVGFPLNLGLVLCNSSTAATKTLGSADCFFTAFLQ